MLELIFQVIICGLAGSICVPLVMFYWLLVQSDLLENHDN
jgi:hypothetical protein